MAKARLFISTDMQMITGVNNIGGDKDDVQSLVHALMYQDKFDIVGIASSTSWWQPGANNESFIHHVIDKYGQEQAVLAQNGEGFKSASALHDITYQGTQSLAGASGIVDRTEASDAIIQQAREASAAGEKLYVATWGGLGDMARALYDAPEIASTVRLLSVVGPQQEPNAYNYIKDNFAAKGDLWWVDEKSTHYGVYATPSTTGAEQTDPAGNIWSETNARGHGVLGQFFYENTLDILGTNWPGDGLKMGDSHTVLYLTDTPANNDDPTAESWGGEFQQAGDKYWVDRSDQGFGWEGSEGARTIYEDRDAWTGDFAARFDWLQAPAPVAVTPVVAAPVVAPPEAPTPEATSPVPAVPEPVVVSEPSGPEPAEPVSNQPTLPAPTGAEVGSDTIVVKLSQDAYLGDAQYAISVDGKQVVTGFVNALHATGDSQAIVLPGEFGTGQHTVSVAFLNDAWDGTPDTDRNLHVDGISFNGVDAGQRAALYSAGSREFDLGVTAPVPASVAAPQPAAATDQWAAFTHDGVVDWAAASAAVTAHYEATGYWGL